MKLSQTGRICTPLKWIVASLVLTVFMSSCSQKMALVKSIRSQPAFVQAADAHRPQPATESESKVVSTETTTHLISTPTPTAPSLLNTEKTAKNTRRTFVEKAAKSMTVAKVIKNIQTKTPSVFYAKTTEHGAEIPKYLKFAIIFALAALIFELLPNSIWIFGWIGGVCWIIAIIFVVLWVLQQ